MFKVRLGGLVAYGGFLGGYIGSWAFLKSKRIRLMPWADVAVPSLASGLMITRIGCYLFGCDFGKRLPRRRAAVAEDDGDVPALGRGNGRERRRRRPRSSATWRSSRTGRSHAELTRRRTPRSPCTRRRFTSRSSASSLLALLLLQRRSQKFRGQIFFLFVFGYGYLRFLLEILRDDVERGEYGPVMPEHVLIPGALLLMSIGVHLRDRARDPEQDGAADRARDRLARAAGRGVRGAQAAELRREREHAALDEPVDWLSHGARRVVLLRAVLGRRAQAAEAWR